MREGRSLSVFPVSCPTIASPVNCLPPGVGLAIIHDKIRVSELARGSEFEHTVVDAPVEHKRRVAQGAVGDDNGSAADRIVDDLVPDQHAQRISAGNRHAAENWITGFPLTDVGGLRTRPRIADRRSTGCRRGEGRRT